jgi:hypothetical protein
MLNKISRHPYFYFLISKRVIQQNRMNFFKLSPVFLSFGMLFAHFLRTSDYFFLFLCIIIPCFLLIKRPISVRIIQFSLFLGTVEWIITIISLVQGRILSGQSFLRLIFILSFVALFTAASALIFQIKIFREIYRLKI